MFSFLFQITLLNRAHTQCYAVLDTSFLHVLTTNFGLAELLLSSTLVSSWRYPAHIMLCHILSVYAHIYPILAISEWQSCTSHTDLDISCIQLDKRDRRLWKSLRTCLGVTTMRVLEMFLYWTVNKRFCWMPQIMLILQKLHAVAELSKASKMILLN